LKFFQTKYCGSLVKLKENNTKNKCIDKKVFFLQNIIRESRAIKYPLTNYDTATSVIVEKMAGIFTIVCGNPICV